MTPPDRILDTFRDAYRRDPEIVTRAPGRVCLLGAHVDYSEGWVLSAAIDRSLWVAASPRRDRRLRLRAVDLDDGDGKATAELDLDALPPPRPEREDDAIRWTDYPAAVAWAAEEEGHRLDGLDVAYGGDLPAGSGVSSSAALEMAFLLAWETAGGFELDSVRRATVGQRAENGYLGVGSGIMDQLTSVSGRRGHALLVDCRSLDVDPVPLPADLAILVVDSGVRRRLAGSGFDDRRRQCERAVAVLRDRWTIPRPIRTLRDVRPDELPEVVPLLPPPLDRRARHAVEECRRVLDGADALRRGDVETLGQLVSASHRSSRDLYEVSIPELDALVEAAEAADALGARLSGGGFGGCAVALARVEDATDVLREMGTSFERRFDRPPAQGFLAQVGGGAEVLIGGR